MSHTTSYLIASISTLIMIAGCSSPATSEELDGFVTIPGGTYEIGCDEDGGVCHAIAIEDFEIGKFEITFEEWDRCISQGWCLYNPDGKGLERGRRPVVNIGITHIYDEFIPWMNASQKGYNYSLPSYEQYAILALQEPTISCNNSHVSFPRSSCAHYRTTAPVGVYPPNEHGMFDLWGNVAEWTITKTGETSELGATKYWVFGYAWDSQRKGEAPFSSISLGNHMPNIGFRLVRTRTQTE